MAFGTLADGFLPFDVPASAVPDSEESGVAEAGTDCSGEMKTIISPFASESCQGVAKEDGVKSDQSEV